MASVEELYHQAMTDERLRAELAEAQGGGGDLSTFLAAHGCDAGPEEALAFLRSRQGEMADDELEGVSGGGCGKKDDGGTLVSDKTCSWCHSTQVKCYGDQYDSAGSFSGCLYVCQSCTFEWREFRP